MLNWRPNLSGVVLRAGPIGEVDAVRLCEHRLPHISQLSGIQVPSYDRSSVRLGVLNLGLRNFHRVHNAVYFDEILHSRFSRDWGMISVGLTDSHRRAHNSLKNQDGLYTIIAKDPSGLSNIRVIGSILDTMQCPSDTENVMELIAHPSIKLILLTMKENNYYFTRHFDELDLSNPKVQTDLITPFHSNSPPRTPVGILSEGLFRRFKSSNRSPVTILCCDNIRRGGDASRGMITLFASFKYNASDFGTWINENVFFPNSICDRICHTDSSPDYESFQQTFGVRDDALLTTEQHSDWVIEKDKFVHRPDNIESIAGIRLVDDIGQAEDLKLRLNYGTRLAVACVGTALEYKRFEDALEDPAIRRFCHRIMDELLPGHGSYKEELIQRIGTKDLRYLLSRVIEDTSTKLKMNWQPAIESRDGGGKKFLGLTIAVWARLLAGKGLKRLHDTVPTDVHLNTLSPLAESLVAKISPENVDAFTLYVFGPINGRGGINHEILTCLQQMEYSGVRGTLELYNKF